MKIPISPKTILLGFLLSISTIVSAQDDDRLLYHFETGLGLSRIDFSGGIVGINITNRANLTYGRHLFGISYTESEEFALFTEPNEKMRFVNFTYGRVYAIYEDRFLLTYQTGISWVSYKARTHEISRTLFNTTYDSEENKDLGIPLEFSFQTNFFKYAGFSTRFFAVFSSFQPVFGFTTSLCFGLLR